MNWEDGFNPSTLVHGLHSMRRLKRFLDGEQLEPTRGMVLGTCTHLLLLEPDEFGKRFVVEPDFHLEDGNADAKGRKSDSKATNYVKARRAEFAEQNQGREVVSVVEYNTAAKMVRALWSHHSAHKYLTGGIAERKIFGVIDDVAVRGRPDYVKPSCIVDVKTTTNLKMFGRTFGNLGYGFKMAMYQEIVRQEIGERLPVFMVAQEDRGDYDTAVFHVPVEILDNGLAAVRRVIRDMKRCIADNRWPGIDGGEESIAVHVPLWAMEDEDCLDWSEA